MCILFCSSVPEEHFQFPCCYQEFTGCNSVGGQKGTENFPLRLLIDARNSEFRIPCSLFAFPDWTQLMSVMNNAYFEHMSFSLFICCIDTNIVLTVSNKALEYPVICKVGLTMECWRNLCHGFTSLISREKKPALQIVSVLWPNSKLQQRAILTNICLQGSQFDTRKEAGFISVCRTKSVQLLRFYSTSKNLMTLAIVKLLPMRPWKWSKWGWESG